MNTPLGKNQVALMRALKRHNGVYYNGCGWVWDTHRGTVRLLESLMRRGLVETNGKVRRTDDVYRLTDAGREWTP